MLDSARKMAQSIAANSPLVVQVPWFFVTVTLLILITGYKTGIEFCG